MPCNFQLLLDFLVLSASAETPAVGESYEGVGYLEAHHFRSSIPSSRSPTDLATAVVCVPMVPHDEVHLP